MPDRVVPRTDEAPRLPPPVVLPPTAVATATPPRRYLVVRGGVMVGWSRLEFPIPGGRAAAGVLHPGPGYEPVRAVFRLYRRAGEDVARLREFVRERDGLRLRLLASGGEELRATVELISEWEDGRVFVHVAVEDPSSWRTAR